VQYLLLVSACVRPPSRKSFIHNTGNCCWLLHLYHKCVNNGIFCKLMIKSYNWFSILTTLCYVSVLINVYGVKNTSFHWLQELPALFLWSDPRDIQVILSTPWNQSTTVNGVATPNTITLTFTALKTSITHIKGLKNVSDKVFFCSAARDSRQIAVSCI
jgi:hypothetical protein